MSQLKDVITFEGGMDFDSPDELVAKGDYRSLTNGRIKYGKVVSLKGNTNLNNYTCFEGQSSHNPTVASTAITIASCLDLANNAIIYFVYDSITANCAIYRSYSDNNFIETIIQNTILNFSATTFINANVLEGFLFWTNYDNPPRMIDISRAVDMNLPTYFISEYYINGEMVIHKSNVWKAIGTSAFRGEDPTSIGSTYWTLVRTSNPYSSIDAQTLEVIKFAPYIEITSTYHTNSSYNTNYLHGKVFQFAYRFVYTDNGKSVLSPYSKVIIPDEEYYVNNESNLDTLNNNELILQLRSGHILIKKIEIFVREKNIGNWFYYDSIDKYDSSDDYETIKQVTGNISASELSVIELSTSSDIKYMKIGTYLTCANFANTVYVTAVGSTYISVNENATGSGDVDVNIIAYNNGFIPYQFLNNKAYIAVDQDDLDRPYDYIPRNAKYQDIIEQTKLCYANYKSGFDNVDLDVTLSRTNVSMSSVGTYMDSSYISYPYLGLSKTSHVLIYKFTYLSAIPANSYLTILIKLYKEDSNGKVVVDRYYPYNILLTASDVDTSAHLWAKIISVLKKDDAYAYDIDTLMDEDKDFRFFNTSPSEYMYADIAIPLYNTVHSEALTGVITAITDHGNSQINLTSEDHGLSVSDYITITNPTYTDYEGDYYVYSVIDSDTFTIIKVYTTAISETMSWERKNTETITADNVDIDVFVSDYVPTKKTWKDGDIPFGLEYADEAGRFGNINISDSTKISIPTIPQRYRDAETNSSTPYSYVKINWDIAHRPPTWAYYWRWVVYDSVSSYTQFKFRTYRVDGGKIRIWFNEFIQIWNNNNGSHISEYVYQKGDRFKLLGIKATGGAWASVDVVLEGAILGSENNDDGHNEIIVDGIFEIVDYDPDTNFSYMLGEVFTPSKTISEKVYREIGETYTVGGAGTTNCYHETDVSIDSEFLSQTTVAGSHATGYFLSGNAYAGYRNDMYESFPCIRQDMQDLYDSDVYDFGRRNVEDVNAEEKEYTNNIRYGGNYINVDATNYIAKFGYANYVSLNKKFGDITGIKENKNTLKVLMEHMEVSIYLGRTEMVKAEGSNDVVTSDDVLGTINYYADDYGCQSLRTMIKHNRYIYYFDLSKGVVIRTSPNGQYPISKYKFESWFKEKAKTLRESSNTVNIFATFIDDFDEYVLCLQDGYSVTTIVFNELKNRWTHYLSSLKIDNITKIEHLESMGQRLYSFMEGEIYRHEDNSIYNYLYGEQRDETIQFLSNINALNNKVFQSITLNTDNNRYNKSDDSINWSISTIATPSSSMYPSGMSSRLKAKQFKAKEGNLHSEFLRDMNTPNMTGEKNTLLNGRMLRGKILDLTIVNSNTEEVNLTSSVVSSDLSELNDS